MGVNRVPEHQELSFTDVDRFLVVDVETTGVLNVDRVVEIAAVTISPRGEILDEWDTLINPDRDVGPTHIHGITASMVSAAPRFEEAASALAARLQGAVLVAHNLPFDSRMLGNEYERLGAALNPGSGVCTMSQCGGRLVDACARYGITLDRHHRALADARATASLFLAAGGIGSGSLPAFVQRLQIEVVPRTLRRDALATSAADEMPYLARLAALSHHRQQRGPHLVYTDMLDRALDDLVVSPGEWAQLWALAASLGMSADDVASCHDSYMRELVAAAARDNRITDAEYALLERVSHALGIAMDRLAEALAGHRQPEYLVRVAPGMTVCFTGTATYSDGSEIDRSYLMHLARELGLEVVDSVTKKRCALLVAADASSQSTKANKARGYGIPIASVQDFLCVSTGGGIPAC